MKTPEHSKKYPTERLEAVVLMDEYMRECVDVPVFLEYCKECRNYGKVWSCPPYDFSPEEYWKKFQAIHIIGWKIYFPEEVTRRIYEEKEREELCVQLLFPYKQKLTEELLQMEKEIPGSVSLRAGSCLQCKQGNCARLTQEPCRFPDQMRYSIESIGGNVGKTVTKYLHQELQWMEEGKMPEYFTLVCALLLPDISSVSL